MTGAAAVATLLSLFAEPDVPVRDLADLFKSVCTEGEAKFAKGSIRPIEQRDVPLEIRKYLSEAQPDSRSLYRIEEGPNPIYLITAERRQEDHPEHEKHCLVASKGFNFRDAVNKISPGTISSWANEHPELAPSPLHGYQTTSMLGYVLKVDLLEDGYLILYSRLLGESERNRVLRRMKPSTDKAARKKARQQKRQSQKEGE